MKILATPRNKTSFICRKKAFFLRFDTRFEFDVPFVNRGSLRAYPNLQAVISSRFLEIVFYTHPDEIGWFSAGTTYCDSESE